MSVEVQRATIILILRKWNHTPIEILYQNRTWEIDSSEMVACVGETYLCSAHSTSEPLLGLWIVQTRSCRKLHAIPDPFMHASRWNHSFVPLTQYRRLPCSDNRMQRSLATEPIQLLNLYLSFKSGITQAECSCVLLEYGRSDFGIVKLAQLMCESIICWRLIFASEILSGLTN